MIHYTLKGPTHTLEIHDDKIRLKRRVISRLARGPHFQDWDMSALANFEVSIPQYILWGKLEWKSSDEKLGSFRFSTNKVMVEKIEKYMQKVIQKNVEAVAAKVVELKPKKSHKKEKRAA